MRAAAVALALLVAAACSKGDGRTLSPPAPGATAPPRTTSTTGAAIAPASPAAPPFELTGDLLVNGQAIPTRHSCDGDGTSPSLRWTGVPADAAALALVVSDVDAGDFVHWVVWNIPRDTTDVAEASAPPGLEGRNDGGGTGWTPPCPPRDEAHRYVFSLHALRRSLEIDAAAQPRAAKAAIEGATLAQTTLTGTFVRQ